MPGRAGDRTASASSTACSPSRCGTAISGQLFLARDRLGKKPLYYAAHRTGALAFGSEMQALTPLPELRRRISPHGRRRFLRATATFPTRTASTRRVEQAAGGALPAARARTARRSRRGATGSVRPAPRADRRGRGDGCSSSIASPAATARRLMADVPLGAFLSGGVDSAARSSPLRPAARRAAAHLHDRLSRAPRTKRPLARHGRRAATAPPSTRTGAAPSTTSTPPASQAAHLRRAVRRQLLGADRDGVRARPPARDGRHLRRRRRRGVRAATAAISWHQLAEAVRATCRRRCGARSCGQLAADLSEAGLGAALAARQAHADRDQPRQRARLLPHGRARCTHDAPARPVLARRCARSSTAMTRRPAWST